MSVTVLGRATSINVRKVLWTGVELGLTLAREDVDVTAASFRALNPNAMMPVLIDARGESPSAPFTLWESNPICRYLAAREARSDLLPDDPQARALVEMWMDWQASELNNSWRYAFMALVRGSAAHRDQGLIDAGVAAWNRHMAIIDDQLQRSGGP
ncbi:MAG: glutathione S-transferase, partial [Burkholderiaceae bacterium]